jgi:hypothetical protein
MGLLCRGRRRYNTNKNRRHNSSRSCWRNPFFVFFLSFIALGSLRFRVRTKKAATALLRQHQHNHNNNNNNKNLSPVVKLASAVAGVPVESKQKQKLQLRPRQNHKQKQTQPQSVAVNRTMIRYILTEKGTTESGRAFHRYKAIHTNPKTSAPLQSLASSAVSREALQSEEQPLVAVTVREWAQSLAHNAAVTAPELSAVLRQSPFAAFFLETKGVSADTAALTEFEFVLVDAPQLADFVANKADPAAFSSQLESKKCVAQSIGCQFQNLSGDAVLVAPKPMVSVPSLSASTAAKTTLSSSLASVAAAANTDGMRKNTAQQLLLPYAHLANFVRQAPAHQVTGLWQMAASAYLEALQLDDNNNNNEEDSTSSTGSRSNKLTSTLKKRRRKTSGPAKAVWFSTSGMGVAWLHFRLDQRPKYYTYRAFAEET